VTDYRDGPNNVLGYRIHKNVAYLEVLHGGCGADVWVQEAFAAVGVPPRRRLTPRQPEGHTHLYHTNTIRSLRLDTLTGDVEGNGLDMTVNECG
jgi:hypothetical protein